VSFRESDVLLHSDQYTRETKSLIKVLFEDDEAWHKFVAMPEGRLATVVYSRQLDSEGRWGLFAIRFDHQPAFALVSAPHAGRYNPTDVVWWLAHEDTRFVIELLMCVVPSMYFREPIPLPDLCVLPRWTSHRPARQVRAA
jgi:hypothetical protein